MATYNWTNRGKPTIYMLRRLTELMKTPGDTSFYIAIGDTLASESAITYYDSKLGNEFHRFVGTLSYTTTTITIAGSLTIPVSLNGKVAKEWGIWDDLYYGNLWHHDALASVSRTFVTGDIINITYTISPANTSF